MIHGRLIQLHCRVSFSVVKPYPEDWKFGPKILKKGTTRRASTEREAMLMVSRGSLQETYANFTGYFVGFEFYAKRSKFINLQLYR